MKRLVVPLSFWLSIAVAQRSVTIPDPGGTDRVNYPASFTEEQIRSIMRLSPKLRAEDSYPVMNQIEMCVQGDQAYKGCGTREANDRWFAENAAANIKAMENALRGLDEIPASSELDQVVAYEKALQQSYIDVNKARLQF